MKTIKQLKKYLDTHQEDKVIERIEKGKFFLNEQDEEGYTLLTYAIKENKRKLALLLIDKGFDVNILPNNPSAFGSNLFWAIFHKDEIILEKMIKNGYDFKLKNKKNGTYILSDIFKQATIGIKIRKEHIMYLDKYAYLFNAKLKDKFNEIKYKDQIFELVKEGSEEKVKKIFKETNLSTELKDRPGFTPLLWAIKENHESIATWLLKKGANPNISANGGQNTLMWATHSGNISLIKKLLEYGYDLNQKEIDSEDDEEYYILETVLNHWLKDDFKQEFFSFILSCQEKMDDETIKVFKKIRLYKTVN